MRRVERNFLICPILNGVERKTGLFERGQNILILLLIVKTFVCISTFTIKGKHQISYLNQSTVNNKILSPCGFFNWVSVTYQVWGQLIKNIAKWHTVYLHFWLKVGIIPCAVIHPICFVYLNPKEDPLFKLPQKFLFHAYASKYLTRVAVSYIIKTIVLYMVLYWGGRTFQRFK